MQPKYCLPIIKTSKQAVIETIGAHPDYDFYEVWLDYIDGLDMAFVSQLLRLAGGKLVLLFRRQNLEPIRMSLDLRMHIIDMLAEANALLDLDITQTDELAYIKDKPAIRFIASCHNYRETPPDVQLHQIVASMEPYKPFVYKLSAMCQSEDDALRLLSLLEDLKDRHVNFIILGMGEAGLATRILGMLWGNYMNFAPPTDAEASAPGQLTKPQLEAVVSMLGSN